MKYLPEAIANLEFALRLLTYAEDGKLLRKEMDWPHIRQSQDGRDVISLMHRTFATDDDLLLAVQNNVTIAFGAAAITLNRSIEENGYLPGKIRNVTNEKDACIAVAYQIRNAFAHDIAEPKWEIRKEAMRDKFEINKKLFDLTNLNGKYFDYDHINGISGFLHLRNFAEEHIIVK